MGRHDWADHQTPSYPAPVPGRLRVLVGRSAVIVLVIGALSWISISLIFNPAPDSPAGIQSIALSSAPTPPNSKDSEQVPSPQDPASSAAFPSTAESQAEGTKDAQKLIIHIIGAVKTPGVYELPLGSRVRDAVSSAGGLDTNAAPENINLAANLADGQQVRIPKRGEKLSNAPESPVTPGAQPTTSSESQQRENSGSSSSATGARINVNTAQSAELQSLPGIGPALAQRIIDFRQSNGPFRSLTELDGVSGIGPALLGKIRDRVEFK